MYPRREMFSMSTYSPAILFSLQLDSLPAEAQGEPHSIVLYHIIIICAWICQFFDEDFLHLCLEGYYL